MHSSPPAELLDQESLELSLLVAPDGTILWRDARALAQLGVDVDDRLHDVVFAGMEPKLDELLSRGRRERVRPWELALEANGALVTYAFSAVPYDGAVLLIGSRIPEQFSDTLRQVSDAMGEILTLNRQVLRQKSELSDRHDELTKIHRELEDSNRGVLVLHSELAGQAEALQRTSEVKGRVVANVSHEFRTPLNSILGLSRLLLDDPEDPLSPEQTKQVGFIRLAAEELFQMVNDLLDLSKLESGKMNLQAERFTVGDFFGALRGMLRPLIPPGSQVELVFEDAEADAVLETDRAKASQVVRNLVSNALKFTERGEVRVRAARQPDGQLAISVKDTGIGIAPENHERVFEEFSQIDSPLQRRQKGTGLGLPLARRLAELLGGTLTLQSEPGQGSTFTLAIPPVHPEVGEMQALTERSQKVDPARAPVLVLEDDRKTIFIYERYLALGGFQVIPARTVEDARRLLETVRPSAIVLDVMLEGETSWDFLAELKQNPKTCNIPVLVVTVTNREQKARALGADEFWLKPMDKDRLLQRLASVGKAAASTKVLIIDDDERARYLLQQLLKPTSYRLFEAGTGPEGVRLAQLERPDVIFLDFHLEDRTAFDVLDELKCDPRTRSIPVIINTSHQLDPAQRNKLAQVAETILSKADLSRELAINRIRDALNKAGLGGVPVRGSTH